MQTIDKKEFFAGWRNHKLGNLTKKRIEAMDTLIESINSDPFDFTLQQMAYVLATIYHETGATMAPVKEILQGSTNTAARKAMKKRQARYLPYYGRGYVQITWERNYLKLGKRLKDSHWEYDGVDDNWLVKAPNTALDADCAWDIISVGMREGLFTGKKLTDYISATCSYKGARRIVNGTDKAAKIADYACKFEIILNKCYSIGDNTEEDFLDHADLQITISGKDVHELPNLSVDDSFSLLDVMYTNMSNRCAELEERVALLEGKLTATANEWLVGR